MVNGNFPSGKNENDCVRYVLSRVYSEKMNSVGDVDNDDEDDDNAETAELADVDNEDRNRDEVLLIFI
jgi:hypothetical protein